MIKFKKDYKNYNFKIISILAVSLLCLGNLSSATELHTRGYLRTSLLTNTQEGIERFRDAIELLHNRSSQNERPTKVVFLATSPLPAHPGVGRALGIDTLTRWLRRVMKDECSVQEIDIQYAGSLDKAVESALAAQPDVLGISVRYGTLKQTEEILGKLLDIEERKRPLIVIGGVMPSFLAESIIRKYKSIVVVRGEGEVAMQELVKVVRHGGSLYEVPSLTFFDKTKGDVVSTLRRNLTLQELSDGEFTEDLIPELLARKGVVWVSSSRGCFWNCIFCSVREFRDGKTWEPRPIEDVIAEIKILYDHGVKGFMFADDEMLLGGTDRWIALAEGIKKIGADIRFQCSTRSDSIYSPHDNDQERQDRIKALMALRDAGLQEVYIGFESGSESQLKRYRKGVTVQTHKEAIRICRELGIRVGGGFIMFDPFMNLDEIEENLRFLEDMELISTKRKDFVGDVFDVMRIQEGAPILAMLREAGLLDERIEETLFYNYRFRDPKIGRIVDECSKLAYEIENFMYNLKFIVSAKVMREENAPETLTLNEFLVAFRLLDLDLLRSLVYASRASEYSYESEFNKAVAEFKDKRIQLIKKLWGILGRGGIRDKVAVEVLQARIKELSSFSEVEAMAQDPYDNYEVLRKAGNQL